MVDAVHGPYIAADVGVLAWQTMAKYSVDINIIIPLHQSRNTRTYGIVST